MLESHFNKVYWKKTPTQVFSFEYCENQAAASVKNRTTEIARMHKNVSYKHKKNVIFQLFQVEPKQKFIFLEIFNENVFKSDYFPGLLGFLRTGVYYVISRGSFSLFSPARFCAVAELSQTFSNDY